MKFPALALAVALLGGCATQQVAQLQTQQPARLAQQVGPLNIPFIAQEDYECGPAALAMVMQAAGLNITAEALVPQVYLPSRKGSLQIEMLAATRRQGLVPYTLAPRLQDVLQEVAAGHPVLVFQNLSLPVYPVWHYAVVTGYDRQRNVMLLHSGRTANMEISLYAFERTWARGNYWAMLALTPDVLTATLDARNTAMAIASLETLNPVAAQTAYTAALQRWSNNANLLLGFGNTLYAQHDLTGAARQYRLAVEANPAFADGWNNLAQVLMEQGDKAQALAAVQQAIQIGGPRLAQYEELLREIAP
jgi:Tfp pilus assembly protein PilF